MRRPWIQTPVPVLGLCTAVFIFYQVLIHFSPTIYWDDPHIRWALRDEILLETWLPAIQVFVVLSAKLSPGLYLLKTLMSLLAVACLLGAYVLAHQLFSHAAGLVVLVFLGLNMMFAALSIVPYADVLFLGLAFLAFTLLNETPFTGRFYVGIGILSLSSLTSYAGWCLLVIFVATQGLRSIRTPERKLAGGQTLKMTALCSIAPLAWLLFGVSKSGGLFDRLQSIFDFIAAPAASSLSQHIFDRLNGTYIQEFAVQYFRLLLWQIRVEYLVLAIIGILFAMRDEAHRGIHYQILSFLLLHWLVLAVLQPWKFGSLRQAFLAESFLLLYAAHGWIEGFRWTLQRLSLWNTKIEATSWISHTPILAGIVFSLGCIPSSMGFVVENAQSANIQTPFEIAQWLNARVKPDDVVLVLDDTDYYPYALATYTEVALDRILDDRLDAQHIQASLVSANTAYIVEIYTSRDGLSPTEQRVLQELENGSLPAGHIRFGTASVWSTESSQVQYSP